jgi:hypothetical protein
MKRIGILCKNMQHYDYIVNLLRDSPTYSVHEYSPLVTFERDCRGKDFDFCIMYGPCYEGQDNGIIHDYLIERKIKIDPEFLNELYEKR